MLEDIKKIISDGVLAPSGENCQPWKFEIATGGSAAEMVVRIFNIPEADQSLYNFNQRGSYVAHGALLENISISASKYGYSVAIDIFPSKDEQHLVSTVRFTKTTAKDELKDDGLYPYLATRCTNRKDHTPVKLTSDEKNQLVKAAQETGFGDLKIIDDQETLNLLGKALAMNEEIIFENKHLHDFFYNHILWNESEQGEAGGFYIKTLEFLPHQLKGVKLFKSWGILNFLNKIGKVSKKIAKENAEKYAQSGALAAIFVSNNTDTDFVKSGMTVQRVWLTATKLGLYAHPCTGVLYFMERIQGGDTSSFSPEHVELIKTAYKDIEKAFGAEGKTIPMLFRVGHADAPTARSLRMAPDIKSAIL
jgi:hypothetical protein